MQLVKKITRRDFMAAAGGSIVSIGLPGVFVKLMDSDNQALASDYFVIVQGSDGDSSTFTPPSTNYAALRGDPFATGDLVNTGSANVIRLERGANNLGWAGVVTVVECVANCTTSGFQLLSAEIVNHPTTSLAGNDTTGGFSWAGNESQIMLMGGFNGSGCRTGDADNADHKVCHARIWPSPAPSGWRRAARSSRRCSEAEPRAPIPAAARCSWLRSGR